MLLCQLFLDYSMLRKTIPLMIFFGLFGFQILAQPPMVKYSENLAFFNPAAVAYRPNDSIRVTAFYRNQWIGVTGNPQDLGGTVEYNLSKINSGIGLNFHHDRIGFSRALDFGLSYRYSLKFKNDRALSAGLSLNYYHMRTKGLFTGPQTSFYVDAAGSTFSPRFGLLYSSSAFIAGVSVFHPLQPSLRQEPDFSAYKLTRVYNFHSSYKFRINEIQTLTPELVVFANSFAYFALVNLNWELKEKMFAGGGLKILPGSSTNYAANLRFGYTFFENLYLGAAYECFFRYWNYNPHSMEFVLRYSIKKNHNEP